MAPENTLSIGKISGAHGVNGNLKIHPYADDPLTIDAGSRLFIRKPTDKQERVITVTGWRPHGRGFLLSCREITSRTQAEAESGGELMISRTELPDPGRDTYYWADIIGLSVRTVEDVWIGRVKAIMPTGGHDVYVVYNPETEAEVLIPAIRSVIRDIDLDAGEMRVCLPDMVE